MAWRTITDRHVHASPGQREERSADDRSSCVPRDSRDPNSRPADRPGPIAIAITEANRTRDPWQHSWQHPPCPGCPIRPENRTICAYQTPETVSTQGSGLRALWTEWSVEVRVLSGALGSPARRGFLLLARQATLTPWQHRWQHTSGGQERPQAISWLGKTPPKTNSNEPQRRACPAAPSCAPRTVLRP